MEGITPEAMKELENPDCEVRKDMEQKYDKYFESELKPIYKKVFDGHDKNKNETIEADEAVALFTNFARLLAPTFAGTFAAFAPLIAEENGASEDKVKEQIEPTMAALTTAFNENKADRCKAAFDALDTDKKGSLSFDNFCIMVRNETPAQKEVYNAMGFGEEAFMAKIGELVKA